MQVQVGDVLSLSPRSNEESRGSKRTIHNGKRCYATPAAVEHVTLCAVCGGCGMELSLILQRASGAASVNGFGLILGMYLFIYN